MQVVGKNIRGEEKVFYVSDRLSLWCADKELVELVVPEGLEQIKCHRNKLTKLVLPDSIKRLECDNNKGLKLTHIPKDIRRLWCDIEAVEHLDWDIFQSKQIITVQIWFRNEGER